MISRSFAACNLFNKAHDASSQLGVCESHECLHEREPVTRGEEVGRICWKGSIALRVRLARRAFKEKWDRDLKDMRDVRTTSGSRLSLVSMMARNTNVPFKGRIQKRKTNFLQIITFGLQRAAGPYSRANSCRPRLPSAAGT
jgi:hypothetical protein